MKRLDFVKNRNLYRIVTFLVLIIAVGFFINSEAKAECLCNWSNCQIHPTRAMCSSDENPYVFMGGQGFNEGSCTPSSTCLLDARSQPGMLFDGFGWIQKPCSQCNYGYADRSTSPSATFSYCVEDCGGVSNPGGGECSGIAPYDCNPNDPQAEDGVYARFYDKNSDYDPNDPSITPTSRTYTNDVSFLHENSFPRDCKETWYTEDFTGYIYLEGLKELRLVTDDNYSKSPSSGKPSSSQCCDGGQNVCGKCEKRWSRASCGADNKRGCINTYGCQWHVWDTSRCSDDVGSNSGLKIGYKFDSTKNMNVPDGEIAESGEISGLTTVIRSGQSTTLESQSFAGDFKEFEPGWYPFQAWYTRSNGKVPGTEIWRKDAFGNTITVAGTNEGADNEYFELQWRYPNPIYSFSNVPSDRFVACGGETTQTDVQGYIWENANASCTSGTEIASADANISVSSEGQTGTWDPDGFSGYSYEVTGIQGDSGNETLTASVTAPAGETYTYELACVDSTTGSVSQISGSSITYEADDSLETINLGFEKVFPAWFQSIGGDVYGGCTSCADSVSMQVPNGADISGGFAGYLIDEVGSLFTESDFSVQDSDENMRVVYDDNKYFVKGLKPDNDTSGFEIENISFTPPSDTSDLPPNWNGLSIDEVYSTDSSLDSVSGTYDVSGDGVAVVYVDGDVTFDDNFRSSNDNRIIFVVNGNVTYSSDIGEVAVTTNTRPHIEASVITRNSITFESTGSQDDTSIIVEGPLVAKDGSVNLNRNRGIENDYPAEIVKFNSIYVTSSADSPISLVNITWELEE